MTVQPGVISYPIPAYQNLPIDVNFYQPSQLFIQDVALGIETLVTTTTAHNYVIGQEVRLLIPSYSGCFQLNGKLGYVLSIPQTDQVNLSIDSSRNVDPFILTTNPNQPQIVAVGDINSGQINSNGRIQNITYPPGAFINISPQ